MILLIISWQRPRIHVGSGSKSQNVAADLIMRSPTMIFMTIFCPLANHDPSSKVLWRSCVILRLCSQNSQKEWVRYPLGQHQLIVEDARDFKLTRQDSEYHLGDYERMRSVYNFSIRLREVTIFITYF